MEPSLIFQIQLVLGYAAWALCFGAFVWPRLRAMDAVDAIRVVAALHSFRFLGLLFILPGMVGPGVPAGFSGPAALGDLATALLAMIALLAFNVRPVFWVFAAAFNLVGAVDLGIAYYHAVRLHLPEVSGQLGSAYLIPILYVPILALTHGAAMLLMARLLGADSHAKVAEALVS
jgi:hypothetical protein